MMIDDDFEICINILKSFICEHKNFKINFRIKRLIKILQLDYSYIPLYADFTINVVRYLIFTEKNCKVKHELQWLLNDLIVSLEL